MESRSWRDRNLKFGPNCDLEVDNLEKNKKFDSASPRQIFYFIPNFPPPDHNLGQILNSDPASSYFPLEYIRIFVCFKKITNVTLWYWTEIPHKAFWDLKLWRTSWGSRLARWRRGWSGSRWQAGCRLWCWLPKELFKTQFSMLGEKGDLTLIIRDRVCLRSFEKILETAFAMHTERKREW